ncbi:MAG: hypothetical protein AAFP17_02295 [Pseudomonadota bacterium]
MLATVSVSTLEPVPAAAQSSALPEGRIGTTYGTGRATAPYSGRQDSSAPSGRTAQPYSGGRSGTTYDAGNPYRNVGADAIARVNDGLRESCETQLREDYGAEEVGDLEMRRRSSDRKRIYTTITRADGATLNVRCVVRNGRLTTIQTGDGDDWTEAELYERPPEEEAPEETAEDGSAPGDAEGEERAEGEAQPGDGDGAEGNQPDGDGAESDTAEGDGAEAAEGETAEAAEQPSGPKRIRVPTSGAPRL